MRALCYLLVIFVPAWVVAQTRPSNAGDSRVLTGAGIPAFDRAWSGDDYLAVQRILTAGKIPPPQVTNETGRLFFARLTSVQNLEANSKSPVLVTERFDDFVKVFSSVRGISKLYDAASKKGLDVRREKAEMAALSVRVGALGVQLLGEMVEVLPAGMVSAEIQERIYGPTNGDIAAAEVRLSDPQFRPEDRALILVAMAESAPVLKKGMTIEGRTALRKKFEAHLKAFSRVEDKRNIQKIIESFGE